MVDILTVQIVLLKLGIDCAHKVEELEWHVVSDFSQEIMLGSL